MNTYSHPFRANKPKPPDGSESRPCLKMKTLPAIFLLLVSTFATAEPKFVPLFNGTTITEANLDELNKKFPDHQGAKRRSGHLALCGHGDRVAFRNFRIAEPAAK